MTRRSSSTSRTLAPGRGGGRPSGIAARLRWDARRGQARRLSPASSNAFCLGAQTCAPPSGAITLLILSLGTGVHSPSNLDLVMVADHAALRWATVHQN